MDRYYFHMYANGDDAKNFITSELEFKSAFNRFGICSIKTGATVVSCSVEDSHPHALLWGTETECTEFKIQYERTSLLSIAHSRGTASDVRLECDLYLVDNESYLMNVATYTIVQATKDGKAVMPYDYLYGTGALYFRTAQTIYPWLVGKDGTLLVPRRYDSLTVRQQRELCRTTELIPGSWLICNGFILPQNYVDIDRFESIYRTHNCYRAFLCSGKSRDEAIRMKMSSTRGVFLEDLEARRISENICFEMFGCRTARHLDTDCRLRLAQMLRSKYRLYFRQLSLLTRIPESELRKYVR